MMKGGSAKDQKRPVGKRKKLRGVAIFAKAFMGIPAQQAAKITRPLMPSAAPAVLLHSLHTQQGVRNIVIAMTRRDFGKPAFSLRKKRSVKTHALSLLGTTRLLSRSERAGNRQRHDRRADGGLLSGLWGSNRPEHSQHHPKTKRGGCFPISQTQNPSDNPI